MRCGGDQPGVPAEHWERYGELDAKRRAETLPAEEHAEMLALIQIREEANVQRFECLAAQPLVVVVTSVYG